MPETSSETKTVPTVSIDQEPDEQIAGLIDKWKSSVAFKKGTWFVGKFLAGTAAAGPLLTQLHSLGLTLEPGSFLAAAVPKLLPAVLGAMLHVAQDAAALKTQAKWL